MLVSIVKITTASQSYFNDIGYWPVSIRSLIDTNYLKNKFDGYALLSQNGQLNIVIDGNNKNNSVVKKYFIEHKINDKTKAILIKINKGKRVEKVYLFGICSNLYCQSYKVF